MGVIIGIVIIVLQVLQCRLIHTVTYNQNEIAKILKNKNK